MMREWNPSVSWKDVVGRNEWRYAYAGCLGQPGICRLLGEETMHRFILVGKAGSGRHTVAEAMAADLKRLGYRCYAADRRDLCGEKPGQEREQMTALFQAFSKEPSCLLLESAQELSQDAAWLLSRTAQELERQKTGAVFFLLYEKEEQIPERLFREFVVGRFSLPSPSDRAAFMDLALGTKAVRKVDLTVDELARLTEGMTFGEMKQAAALALRILYAQTVQDLAGDEEKAAGAIQKGLSRLSARHVEMAAELSASQEKNGGWPVFSAGRGMGGASSALSGSREMEGALSGLSGSRGMEGASSGLAGRAAEGIPSGNGVSAYGATASAKAPGSSKSPASGKKELSEDILVDQLPSGFDF